MAIADKQTAFQRLAQGNGFESWMYSVASGTTTAANAGCGFISGSLQFLINTTRQGFRVNTSVNQRIVGAQLGITAATQGFLGWLYHFGDCVITATGDQFTRDAGWTGPITRTVMGQATQPIDLWPLLYVQTTTATTAAVLQLSNVAGTSGYVDQDGNTVVGAKTMTLPSVSTVAQSTYVWRLEDDDRAVRDIISVKVNTATASGGPVKVYGFEPILYLGSIGAGFSVNHDSLISNVGVDRAYPGSPTTGSFTTAAELAIYRPFVNGSCTPSGRIWGVTES